MMSKTDDGGQAFPVPASTGITGDPINRAETGMTLRDYFAAQAIDAATEAAAKGVPEYEMRQHFGERGGVRRVEIIAALAYSLADAMLAERSKP